MGKEQAFTLAAALEQAVRRHPFTHCRRPAPLARLLRKRLAQMKRLYRTELEGIEKTPVSRWLCDNYYVLEKETKQTIRALRGFAALPTAGKLPQLYWLCVELLAEKTPVTEAFAAAFVAGIQQHRNLTVTEFDFLPLALKAALLGLACAACNGEGGESAIALAITSLTRLSGIDFDALTCRYSIVEQILAQDPAEIYLKMEKESRGSYRALVSSIAQKTKQEEREAAQQILNKAKQGENLRTRHVGYFILNHRALLRENRWRRGLYLFGTPFLTALSSVALGLWAHSVAAGILAFFPVWEVFRPALESLIMARARLVQPPRMQKEYAAQCSTVVAVSALMPKAGAAAKAARHLEELYWSNVEENLSFCLLVDFKESDAPSSPEDESQVAALAGEIRRLNAQYGSHFLLFVRGRSYNKTQNRFSGWERKRGAITELIRYAKGDATTLLHLEGNPRLLTAMQYLLALDSDTNLLFDTAGRLICAAAHPLNKAVENSSGVVTQGYGIFVPRMTTTLESQGKTTFSRIMAGIGGVTAYDTAARDVYQDLFGEAIFSGKGLLDVDCFYRLLNTRFAENTVLSHDILEGAYLRTALLSDVELSDSFPSGAGAWLARLHRWVRGDWQNLRCIFEPSPISLLNRFKLFDNLRRSLTPVLQLACVLAALLLPHRAAAALFWVVLFSVSYVPLLGALAGMCSMGPTVFSRKFFTRVVPQVVEQLAKAAFAFILLPQTALRCADAIFRALWRQFVSHKNMLEWVTAAELEGGSVLRVTLRQFWQAELLGLAVLVLSPHKFLRLYGLLFVAAIPLAVLTGRVIPRTVPRLEEAEKQQVTAYAAAMWDFFASFVTEKEHFLPPDNIQQAPVYAVAHRTSPTNIGLLLLATLTARDFSFITSEELAQRLSRTLSTVERLEKWHGNLYNWYDTTTLALLEPRFISSVDSGNFICCLVALAQGVQEYSSECPQLALLLPRLEALIAAADLSVFYSKQRNLLSIGYNATSGEMMDSFYDFLMSEARMTSYYAIATRQISKRHWGVLNRTMSRQGGYAGTVSWTGTMFEYYMPHLLLPVYEGSLLCEALSYCLYTQRCRVREEKLPWGISESAYYLFDGQLHYQYKAHGVQKLGVKRGLDSELVVSPYSTFLALPFHPVAALKNLRLMEQMGFSSTYGFYEAIDFTKARVTAQYGVCRSYMSHHVGMSLISAGNAVFDFNMQRRFLRDHRMNAAKELLQEKVARDTVVYDNIKFKDFKEREAVKMMLAEEFSSIRPQTPRAMLLGNGALTSLLTDTGASWLGYGGVELTRRCTELLQNPSGVFAFLDVGDAVFSLTQAPIYDATVHYQVRFLAGGVVYKARAHGVKTGVRVLLHPTLPCEQREYQIKNQSQQQLSAKLLLYLEPVLAAFADYTAHPAFSKLFVTAEYEEKSKVLIFSRRERTEKNQRYFAVGLLEDLPFEFETKRENLMRAPNGLRELLHFSALPFSGGTGTPDAACALRLALEIPAGARVRLTQLLSAGQTREEAVMGIIKLRRQGKLAPDAAPKSPLLGVTIEGRIAAVLLPQLLFCGREGAEQKAARAANTLGKKALWSLSVSGDQPIVLFLAEQAVQEELACVYLSLYRRCKLAGVAFDLVFLCGGEHSDSRACLTKCVQRLALHDRLGAGIYLLESEKLQEGYRNLLFSVAAHVANQAALLPLPELPPYEPVKLNSLSPDLRLEIVPELTVTGGVFASGRFYVRRTPQQSLPFSHILANPAFGTLLGDTALGYSWAVNARENKLTPWYNDLAQGNNGERLILQWQGDYYDLISGSACSFSAMDARYEGTAKTLASTVTVTVPEKGCVKQVEVVLTNRAATACSITLAYYTEPVLGVDRTAARQIVLTPLAGGLLAESPFQTAVRGVSYLWCDAWQGKAVCDRAEFFSGRWASAAEASAEPCAAILVPADIPAGASVTLRFRLIWAANRAAAVKLSTITLPPPFSKQGISLKTPEEPLNQMISHFLPHQILACRMWGRTAFYQCGGAYGFRDQLQDATACLLFHPQAAKYQILRAAAAQFRAGDVLHWWHCLPQNGGGLRGVRTKYSDDLLWLPFAACEYTATTGENSLWATLIPYVQGEELGENETERYFQPERTSERESLYHHCVRAIDRACRFGGRGLPLIGCGDWNDGFNTVGNAGKGESVWLAMFLCIVLQKFLPVVREEGEESRAREYQKIIEALKAAIDRHCWDGAWYLRAFYDDGTAMGSGKNEECRIDSLPQSFSALCGMPHQERVNTALDSALHQLADPKWKLVRLFDAPFASSAQRPGYVKAYPAGIRENGGQYTHAGVWLALALLHEGRAEEGCRLLRWLNPAARCEEEALARCYKQEPYYLAADIYTNADAMGRGGWSLYTGAAGWYYKTVLEALLGITRRGTELLLSPTLPPQWQGFQASLTLCGTALEITVERGKTPSLTANGTPCSSVLLDGTPKEVHMVLPL